ncbi:MAG: phage/plasmid primase, P4 family, partial [Planctomycetota bacterium]
SDEIICKGDRNSTLFQYACSLRRNGEPLDGILTKVSDVNKKQCNPPLPDGEVLTIVQSASRYSLIGTEEKEEFAKSRVPESHLSDMGNARSFVILQKEVLAYAKDMEAWFRWDERRFERTTSVDLMSAAKKVPIRRYQLAHEMQSSGSNGAPGQEKLAALTWAAKSESNAKLRACLEVAASEPEFSLHSRELDTHLHLLTVLNGIVDLRTGQLLPHDRSLKLTKLSPIHFDTNAPHPLWTKFLDDVFIGDSELIEYIQRAVGYSLTGDMSEQCFFILYNSGANGKSTFINIISAAAGEHARSAQFDTFLAQKRNSAAPSPDLAALRAARLVTAVEAEAGARLNESIIKQITGGDPITCRELNEGLFTYRPQFKLFLSANHKPVIRGTDYGIWRRPRLIPFDAIFKDTIDTDDDPRLCKLKNRKIERDIIDKELGGVLAWAVEGAMKWYQSGLGNAQRIESATREYRDESDVLGRYLEECTVRGSDCWCLMGELYKSYTEWTRDNGEFTMSQSAFGRALVERGIQKGRNSGFRTYHGIMTRSVGSQNES